MSRLNLIFTLIVGLLIISGCSGTSNPAIPEDPDSKQQSNTPYNIALMVDAYDSEGNPVGGSGAMGLFNVYVNMSDGTGEISPLRNIALDDTLEMVDITNFLSLAPCTDCAKLFGIEIDVDGNVVLYIGVKHPFEEGDPFKPITGKNRADLHVFNVEGTVVFKDNSGVVNYLALGVASVPGYLVNADGYSPYLDIMLDNIYPTLANIHPYILHFDDYTLGSFDPLLPTGFESVTIPHPSGNLVMPMGSDYDVKPYKFVAPEDESLEFMFAVGCTYAVSSTSKQQRFNPEYQIPEHNKKAASEVSVEIVDNNLAPGDTASSCDLLIKVLDMNHGVDVGTGLDQMRADSSVGAILLEVPGVTSGSISGSTTPISGDGRDPANPLTFSMSFLNSQGAPEGEYFGLIKVVDTYQPGLNESPLLDGMDAIERVGPIDNPLTGLYSLTEFATYMVFNVEISASSGAPVASFITDPEGFPNLDFDFMDYVTITFTSTSYDPDDSSTPEGQIVLYEWDFTWDGDPATFEDKTGGVGTGEETWEVDRAGTWYVGLRVTDGGDPPLTSDIYSIQMNVGKWSRDFTLSDNNGRVPKIAELSSGKVMAVWASAMGQVRYAMFEDNYSDPNNAWSSPEIIVNTLPTYLSIFAGPGEDECWLSGNIKPDSYVRFYRYDGTSWSQTAARNLIGTLQTHIFADDFGGYDVFNNSQSAFGWLMRMHYDNINVESPSTFTQYINYQPYNNRLLGESRIIAKNSSGKIFLAYLQDLAIDPYRTNPPDYRYILVARMDQSITGYEHAVIDEGNPKKLDSIVIACDSNDKLHVAYRKQVTDGGNYAINYKSSSNDGVSFNSLSTIWTGSAEPNRDYISIHTDPNNRIMVTYRVNNNIYWVYSDNGSTWSEPEIVNTTWPGGSTADKEQFMLLDSKGRTHVIWDRCETGETGFGPITHKVRAPLH